MRIPPAEATLPTLNGAEDGMMITAGKVSKVDKLGR